MSYGANGEILVTFATIAEAAQNVNKTYNTLNQKLDDLKQMLAPVVNTWSGQAAENYQQKQAQWNTAQQDLSTVLQSISQILDATHDAYTNTERANANTWQ